MRRHTPTAILFACSILLAAPFGAAARSATIGAASVGGSATDQPPPALAEPTPPKLTRIDLGPHPVSYGDMSRDGVHVWIGFEHTVWDFIAGHLNPMAPDDYGYTFGMASRDGEAITLRTLSQLVPEDTDNFPDDYLRTASWIKLLPDAQRRKFISNGGDLVVFSTHQPLTAEDTDDRLDDYLWRATTGTVQLLSSADGDPIFLAATDDGSRILLTDQAGQIIDWTAGTVRTLATGTFLALSADGARVYVNSLDQLVPDDLDAAWDAYVVTDGGVNLLSPGQSEFAAMSFEHVSDDGSRWILYSASPLLPADLDLKNDNYLATETGLFLLPGGIEDAWVVATATDLSSVVLRTRSALVPEDVDGMEDLYRWTAAEPDSVTLLTSGTHGPWTLPKLEAMSADGTRLIISTEETLLPESEPELPALNSMDVYEWHEGAVTNLAPGAAREVRFLKASTDARRVAFTTKSGLVPEDPLTDGDVYLSDRDVTPPTATIDGPTGTTESTTATIQFGTVGSDGVVFECTLDVAAFDQCPGSVTFTDLAAGPHSVSVRAFDLAGNASDPASVAWVVGTPPAPDLDAPQPGSFEVASGIAYTTSTIVSVSTPAEDAGSGVSHVALSNDGTSWTERPYAATQEWVLPSANGTRTVYAKWRDTAGNWSGVVTDEIVLDTVAPTASAPTASLLAGTAISSGRASMRLRWTGADATSGVERYDVRQRIDGGAWTNVPAPTAARVDRLLGPDHSYEFRVRAVDRAGNVGAWVTAPAFRLSKVDEGSTSIKLARTWKFVKGSAYWGGRTSHSTAAGATATWTFTGRTIGWVARKGPDRGVAQILVGGVVVATVDLYAPTFQDRQLVWTRTWARSASRKVTIKVVGTAGRPAIDLDALLVAN